MSYRQWTKRDPVKNYFPLPNEIFSLGLSATAIAVYGYLLRRENRETYECLASYRMIGQAIGKSVTTVRKYVVELEERGLVTTERTSIMTKDGRKWNGCLRYHILPIQLVIDRYTERQLRELELSTARLKAQAKLERRYHEDGSRSMTMFIEHALDFYLDYLSAQDAGLFLPAAIRSCINGRLGTMENRMASLMFKLIVEVDMCMSILADCTQLDEEYLRRKRAESVDRAKRTNGQTRFEQIARHIEDD